MSQAPPKQIAWRTMSTYQKTKPDGHWSSRHIPDVCAWWRGTRSVLADYGRPESVPTVGQTNVYNLPPRVDQGRKADNLQFTHLIRF
jgi:hypothetical protein